MLSHSSKKAVRVEDEKITFTQKEAESFPYFLNMQKILCLEGDGHAWHWDVILLGCAVPDVGPNCKCNRFCLKRDGRKNRKKRNKGGLPFSRSITKTHSSCWNPVLLTGSSSQSNLLGFSMNVMALSHTHPYLN